MAESGAGDGKNLTEEQEKLLKSLEEEFKNRYTETDEDFKIALETNAVFPPLLINWDKIDEIRDNDERQYKDYNRRHPFYSRDFQDYEPRRNQKYENKNYYYQRKKHATPYARI